MKINKIKVMIERYIDEVFEFTANPKNTPLWISQIKEETSDEYPPKIGATYKNIGEKGNCNSCVVVELEKNKIFTLKCSDNNYFVRYLYKKLDDNKTELQYFEWVKEGKIEKPFTQEVLQNLKRVMEISR